MRAFSRLLTGPLVIIGLALSAATSAVHAQTFSKRIPADPSGQVHISIVAGSVKIIAWDKPEIDVQARLGAGVERLDITQENGRSIIKVMLPRNAYHNDGSAILEVRVPAGSQLETSTVSAPIIVEGVRGSARLNSVSGHIQADVFGADMQAKSVSGNVALRGNGQAADVRMSTVSGTLSLTRGAGRVEANTTSGTLDIALDPARDVRVRTVSGRLKFHGRLAGGGKMEAETISGSLSIQVAAQTGYQYEISSFSGGIHNCFGEKAVRTSQYAPGVRLNGTRGAGEANVRLKTLSGSIDLCDR